MESLPESQPSEARLESHDEWFMGEVEKGLAAAGRNDFIEHDQVRSLIDARYPG